MNLLLIRNPGSRSGRGKRLWGAWEQGLRKAGVSFKAVETSGLGHARELAAAPGSHDTVVAVGGDGTINEVLDGMIQRGEPAVRMGVLYSGTSPDFCRFHGIPVAPDEALGALLGTGPRKVDVARISYRGLSGKERIGHFGCSCNIGLGASVARWANRLRRFAGDALGTGIGLAGALLANRPHDLEVEVDGEAHRLARVSHLTIAKNPYIASGLRLDLEVQPDDGVLWAVAACGQSRIGLCRMVPQAYSGSVVRAPGVMVMRCRSVGVRAAAQLEVEFDGDPRGLLPVQVDIVPRALSLLGTASAG